MHTATQVAYCLLFAHTYFLRRTHARMIIECCPQTIRGRTVHFRTGVQVGVRHKARFRCTISRSRLFAGIGYRERGIVIQGVVTIGFSRPILQTCCVHNMALEQFQQSRKCNPEQMGLYHPSVKVSDFIRIYTGQRHCVSFIAS